MFHGKNCSVIEVLITVSIEKMVLTFQDEGPTFDSERHRKTLDPSLSIDRMEVGGLGILLMQKLVDDLSYTRDKGRNILSLTKKNSAYLWFFSIDSKVASVSNISIKKCCKTLSTDFGVLYTPDVENTTSKVGFSS